MAIEEVNNNVGAVDNTPPKPDDTVGDAHPMVQNIVDPLTINQGPTQVGNTHTK